MKKVRIDFCATEQEEQITFSSWLTIKKIPFFHIPNGGSRHIAEAVKLKMMGVKKGIPDIFIHVAKFPHHGLFIEMKSKDGGAHQKSQTEKIVELRRCGYRAEFAHGCEDAIKIVDNYLNQHKWPTIPSLC